MSYRKKLIESLKNLLTDEFEPIEVMYLTKKELVQKIIECGEYYQQELNN